MPLLRLRLRRKRQDLVRNRQAHDDFYDNGDYDFPDDAIANMTGEPYGQEGSEVYTDAEEETEQSNSETEQNNPEPETEDQTLTENNESEPQDLSTEQPESLGNSESGSELETESQDNPEDEQEEPEQEQEGPEQQAEQEEPEQEDEQEELEQEDEPDQPGTPSSEEQNQEEIPKSDQEPSTPMDVVQPAPQPATATHSNDKELRIGLPTAFLQDCTVYLRINRALYDNDEKRIAFVLSHMTGGDAATWKQQFITSKFSGQTLNLGSWQDFYDDLKASFKEEETVSNTLSELTNLKQGSKTAEQHNIDFCLIAGKAGLDLRENTTIMINFYKNSLNPRLLTKILSLDEVPTTLEKWFSKAITLDNNYRQAMSYVKGSYKPYKPYKPVYPRFNFSN
ncbi:hypothetical protein CVT24_012147 [Panaeolus cyanescens]|uniref:Ty3 transposon capsid-like protein domain-containing protein n=1 Tax=Panaeolus cyanescens TaxID=181874 RepID=A0A409YYQ9_9AGAR|nr:hypothetical protein CVT24_012147 [Panaeolus cyanescens]